jgi:ParB-like chromosome segregation protein Spo0J
MVGEGWVMIRIHPAAEIFPMMSQVELAELAQDIRKNGQRESCVFFQNQLIDGRNRWKACELIGIEPETCEIEIDDFDPVAYVLSQNLYRRHLTESQRAMAANRAKTFYSEKAKERKGGRPKKPTANLQEVISSNGEANEQVAELFKVSPRLVAYADIVQSKGSKELQIAVETGEVAVTKAARIARNTSKSEQMKVAQTKPTKSKSSSLEKVQKAFTKLSKEDQDKFRRWLVS